MVIPIGIGYRYRLYQYIYIYIAVVIVILVESLREVTEYGNYRYFSNHTSYKNMFHE